MPRKSPFVIDLSPEERAGLEKRALEVRDSLVSSDPVDRRFQGRVPAPVQVFSCEPGRLVRLEAHAFKASTVTKVKVGHRVH